LQSHFSSIVSGTPRQRIKHTHEDLSANDFFKARGGSLVTKRDGKMKATFGQRVRELRMAKGLSQEALALACDLDRSYISGVERGERNVSLGNIRKIAAALGVPARDLF